MRTGTSQHLESIRVSDTRDAYLPRSPLNIPLLLTLLRDLLGIDEFEGAGPVVVGTKRPGPHEYANPRKKAKILEDGKEKGKGEDTEEIDLVPALCHVYEFAYSKHQQPDDEEEVDPETTERSLREEEALNTLIGQCRPSSGTKTFDLGQVSTWTRGLNVVVCCKEGSLDDTLLVLPIIPDPDFDSGEEDYRTNVDDVLYCCHTLQDARKVDISSHVRLQCLPLDAEVMQDELPFRVVVETTVSLAFPAILGEVTNGVKINAIIEQRQRRVLSYLFPPVYSAPASYRGNTDIPFLYSILGAAPILPSQSAIESSQPAALLPALLPFQRRSVAWLLQREGKSINENGEITPIGGSLGLPLFWEEVELGGRTFYLHLLKGLLSAVRPEAELQPGGSLNEPPGLGKTVECIALFLLNPGIGRNPSIKRWDVEAKVFVKQVKTTLIVTPPALAPQWVDELKRHAPSLKVFVYDGWQKYQGPITEDDAQDARQKRRKQAVKGKRKASRAKTARKNRSSVWRQVNDETDTDSMDVDSDFENQSSEEDDEEEILDWCSFINTMDVCITTYNVLQQDLSVARPPPVRPRRTTASYTNVERPRSPLVMCEWFRVCMDEVQMAGGGKTSEMVSLIPRISSLAVSGTPARSQISDLIHVLNFLRVKEIAKSPILWNRVLKPKFVNQFVSIFDRYAIRTSKADVEHELTIPKQTRFLVPIELGRVERHVYDQSLEEALLELGYDARGVAAVEGWQVDASLLRTWLRKLRGFCTHPQVGQLQNQRDKLAANGVLKSINEVLDGMQDQNWRNFMEERRNRVQALTRLAQLQQRNETDRARYQHSLETLLIAEQEADLMVQDLKTAIAEHDAKGLVLKQEAAALRDIAANQISPSPEPEVPMSTDKGKGKAREEEEPASTDDPSPNDLPKTPAGEEHSTKRRALTQRLRECHLVFHKVLFLKGDVYHVLGEKHSKEEDASYTKAEELRRKLLKSTEEGAMQAMDLVVQVTEKLTEEDMMLPVPYLDQGGIRSADLVEEANALIDEVLNEQTHLLWEWRTRLISLLTQSLSAESNGSNNADGNESNNADGNEYSRTLETQGEAETFLQAYSALLADRREVLLAERTLLAAHDTRDKNKRKTKTSKMAVDEPTPEEEVLATIADDVELRPEHQVLQKDLAINRKELLQGSNGRAVKSVMVDLNGVAARILNDKDPEKILVRDAATSLRQLIVSQGKFAEKMEVDLSHFRKAFNERVQYFRQLQEISDSVAEAEWEGSVDDNIEDAQKLQDQLETRVNTLRARQRYLNNLSRSQEDCQDDEEEKACILCRCEFITGYVTQCAHVFCEDCLKAWLKRKEGKICPVCRVQIDPNQLQRFSVQNEQANSASVPARIVNNEPVPKSRRQIQYNVIDGDLFNAIQTIESSGSYGSKIQTLVRHLLHLQMTEPSGKSIVFSAWADSLHIIEHALRLNGIPCLRIDQKRNKQSAAKVFADDPNIRVLLLHGERENAGLNIVCASRVFLVESVVNHAFEVQAIARIDRISQTESTQVYCYYAEDTVEKNVLDLAARQGLSLYTQENSAGTLNMSNFTLDSEKSSVDSTTKSKKGQKGDFIFKTDDMLAILFPHMYEDIEYLVPDVDIEMDDAESSALAAAIQINSEAGPSRL